MALRKIYRQLSVACLMISLAYYLFPILTQEPQPTAVSSASALPERRGKVRLYRQSFANYGQPTVERLEDTPPPYSLVDAVLQQTPEVEGRPLLLNYLHQLSPVDKNELQTVLNVAAEARTQLLTDQLSTLDSMEQAKQFLSDLTQSLDGDFNVASSRYLDNLDRRRHIRREISLHEEEIQGLKLETAPYRTQALNEANVALQTLQASLDTLQTDINIYEARLASPETRALLGSQYFPFCERLENYKTALATALDQDVIIDKFDTIFAAMSSVHLEDI